MSLKDYVTLGRSGLRVSPLTLGTMTFGTEWGWGAAHKRIYRGCRKFKQAEELMDGPE